jgi:hypothetical protein
MVRRRVGRCDQQRALEILLQIGVGGCRLLQAKTSSPSTSTSTWHRRLHADCVLAGQCRRHLRCPAPAVAGSPHTDVAGARQPRRLCQLEHSPGTGGGLFTLRNGAQLLIRRWDALTLSLAADGNRQRLADRAHRRGPCATHPTHEAGPSDELQVVKVCYGFDAHSVLRPYADLGGQTANG